MPPVLFRMDLSALAPHARQAKAVVDADGGHDGRSSDGRGGGGGGDSDGGARSGGDGGDGRDGGGGGSGSDGGVQACLSVLSSGLVVWCLVLRVRVCLSVYVCMCVFDVCVCAVGFKE